MNKESLEKMNRMRLLGMHLAFKTCIDANQTEAFTNDELVHHLVQSEWDDRQHRAVQRNLKNANFRYNASLEQLDYSEERGLDKNQVQRLSTCDFIKKGEDLFITGGHSILVDHLSIIQNEKTNNIWGKIQKTDGKYRLMAAIDERCEPYQQGGDFPIYHIALENQDYYGNYGIYANGLLVETCSLVCIVFSKMSLIED